MKIDMEMEMEIERGEDNHNLALSLPAECMTVIFSFVGGNCNAHEDSSYYSCTRAGRFYQKSALVCHSWKQLIKTSLPSLVANLEIVLEGPLLQQDGTDSLLDWLERFNLRPSCIRAPNMFVVNENIALARILQNSNVVQDLAELSLGGKYNPKSSLLPAMQQQQQQQHGDAYLYGLIAKQCPKLRTLDIVLDVSSSGGLDNINNMHNPSEELFSLKSIRSLSITPVYSCGSTSSSVGEESDHRHHNPDLTFITRWVENLPALEHLNLHGSSLQSAPPSNLPLVSDSLATLHGYSFPNHIWINIDQCSKLFPFM